MAIVVMTPSLFIDKGKVQALTSGDKGSLEKLLDFVAFCENHRDCRRVILLKVGDQLLQAISIPCCSILGSRSLPKIVEGSATIVSSSVRLKTGTTQTMHKPLSV